MYIAIKANATIPATIIAFLAPRPMDADIVRKLEVSSLKGSAPALILSARSFADSYVKLPVMELLPSVIADSTVG